MGFSFQPFFFRISLFGACRFHFPLAMSASHPVFLFMMMTGLYHNRFAVILWLVILFPGVATLTAGEDEPAIPFPFDRMFHPAQPITLLPDFTDSYGVVFRDLNRDGFPDLYVVRFRNLNRLFLNQQAGHAFQDFTIPSGLGGNLEPHGKKNLELGTTSGDVNNDGKIDVLIAGWGVSTRIFLQSRGLHFRDITAETDLRPPLDGNGAFLADVNRDGNLDLFITDEHHPNHLYLGDGTGRFREVSREWGVADSAVSQGAAFADVDGDGRIDLYVCNWFAPDRFYRNMGDHFEAQRLPLLHLTDSLNSNGVTFGDIDNDGDLDLLVTDRNRQSRLYRNDTWQGDSIVWQFTDITDSAGIRVPYPAYGSVIADLDNDGWQDIWVNTIGPNMLFRNLGGKQFRKVFQEHHPFWHPKRHYSTGAAVADLDADGDLDLFVANKDTHSVLYINPLNNHHFLQVTVEGVQSNRDAIGARVWCYRLANEGDSRVLVGYREISGGSGYLSQNSTVVHFGTPWPGEYRVRVQFPNGRNVVRNHLRAGQRVVIKEYSGLPEFYFRTRKQLVRTIHQPDFVVNLLLFLALMLLFAGGLWGTSRRYRWFTRHLPLFVSLLLLILYGIFLLMRDFPLHVRLLTQLVLTGSTYAVLILVLEKFRRIEMQRQEYRRLLQDFSRELIFIKDNRKLFLTLCETIAQTIRPSCCAVYASQGKELTRQAAEPEALFPKTVSPVGELPAYSIISPDETKQLFSPASLPPAYAFPLRRDAHLYGILLVGAPKDQEGFTPEDLEVFRTLAIQCAIAVENNRYIEETRKLVQQVTETKIREQYIRELEEKNRKLQQLYSDLKNAQLQLIQSEKMASLGQLVAGIAHELNNPISYIYANMKELENYIRAIDRLLKTLTREASQPDFARRLSHTLQEIREKYDLDFIQQDIGNLIRESIEGSQRVKQVVQNLRNFSRLDEAEFKAVDLHEGLDSTLMLLQNEMKNRITVHRQYGSLPKVHCHPGHLNQVFMNLLLNAVQAIEGQGNIWIRTEQQGEEVLIEIRDDGRGIPPEIVTKIFDPFFTTKPVGQGTGLGLSISYNIIKEHGGRIEVESQPGAGTTFRIYLPIQPTRAGEPETKA